MSDQPTPEFQLNTLVNQMLNTYAGVHPHGFELQSMITLPMARFLTDNNLSIQERYQKIRERYLQDLGYLIKQSDFCKGARERKSDIILFVRAVRDNDDVFTYIRPVDPLAI